MAVYTHLNHAQLESVVAQFSIGTLITAKEASDGIENTTYFLSCGTGGTAQEYVLTVFELLSVNELPFYIDLLTCLANAHLPVPRPLVPRHGQALLAVADKPALLFTRAAGEHIAIITPEHCQVIGSVLADIHLAAMQFPLSKPNPRGLPWMQHAAQLLHATQNHEQRALLKQVLDCYQQLDLIQGIPLPRGIIHGDLFRDNALFTGTQLSAVIDFYNACTDYLLLDLAITVNDWCSAPDGTLDMAFTNALVHAYNTRRPLSTAEWACWPDMLCIAAARFWVSRSLTEQDPLRPTVKSPEVYRQILQSRLKVAFSTTKQE